MASLIYAAASPSSSRALIEPGSRSLPAARLSRICATLRPPGSFATARAFPKISPSIDEDPAADRFLHDNSISDFMRFKRGGSSAGELQTAVVGYRKRIWSLQVDLVSTIHIADKQYVDSPIVKYFETLQMGLESYDCVLYEMVASRESLEKRLNSKSKGKLKSSKSKGFNIIGFIQRQMARILSLDFQLDCLDYENEKWQHADLDFETFKFLQFFVRVTDLCMEFVGSWYHAYEAHRVCESMRSSCDVDLHGQDGWDILGLLEAKDIRGIAGWGNWSWFDSFNRSRKKWTLLVTVRMTCGDERGESFFTLAKEMTRTLIQPSFPGDLGSWKSKLLWVSRVFPMPLVGLFIIISVCSPSESYSTEYTELEALSRLDIGGALKIFLAKRLTSEFTNITAAIEENSVIIGERNKVAIEALRRSINCGHQRIAVLYGGGHMPDLGRRLHEEFDMVPSHVQWITAWSIKNKKLNVHSLPFLKELAKLSGWPLNRYQTLALIIFSSVLALDLWFWELFVESAFSLASSVATEVSLLINM
ncbi:hypothetical protein ZIOFF_037425 [Zingiber officinale]|uniref:Uncharacterized protein n=1 Tax=Zingiber officinale TaxID=94328 RepID=A0A8J5L436_ZINOF|nr:hypothetical protein ZIOFF_037425 [Zingiber officinale]